MTQPWAWREIPEAPPSGGGRCGPGPCQLGKPRPRRGCRAGDVTRQVPTPIPVLRESWEREACGMSRFRGPRDPGGQWSHYSLISCLGFPSLPCPTWEETPTAEPCASWGLGMRGRKLPPTPPPPPAPCRASRCHGASSSVACHHGDRGWFGAGSVCAVGPFGPRGGGCGQAQRHLP